jgi:DNA-binding NarL/FixJ family response regulator
MTPPIRVLIVDDHVIVREGLVTLLAGEPRVTVIGEVGSGAEALRLAAALQPDVVLLDLVLADIDGIEVTRRLQSERQAHVLVLSTYGDDDLVRGAIQAGATGYLLKDILKVDLVEAICSVAAGRPALHPEVQRSLMRQAVTPAEPSPLGNLTGRERDVLACLGRGLTNRQIAADLGLTEGTVKVYVSGVLDKLGVADRTQAALLAVRHGLADNEPRDRRA